MTDQYVVIGNPIAHSKSPAIHALFARQTHQDMDYGRLLAPLDGFAATVAAFRAGGGRGANVTVPFKNQAWQLAGRRSDRAELAGAVNTLCFDADGIFGDNTDGAGLVRDIQDNLGVPLAGRRILLLGAGGAAQGVLPVLLDQAPEAVYIANRTLARAQSLAARYVTTNAVQAVPMESLGHLMPHVIINATASSLAGEALQLPPALVQGSVLVYDMMYGDGLTPFLLAAQDLGARVADGLGMLVEQAAESFYIWRGVRPDTAPVIRALRQGAVQ